MWARILAWAIKIGGAVYRWVIANKRKILVWIDLAWTFVEIVKKILDSVF